MQTTEQNTNGRIERTERRYTNDNNGSPDWVKAVVGLAFGCLLIAGAVWLISSVVGATAGEPNNPATHVPAPTPPKDTPTVKPPTQNDTRNNNQTHIRGRNSGAVINGDNNKVDIDNSTRSQTRIDVSETHVHTHTHVHPVKVVERVKVVKVREATPDVTRYTPSADCERLKADYHRRVASYHDTLARVKASHGY